MSQKKARCPLCNSTKLEIMESLDGIKDSSIEVSDYPTLN